MSLISPEEFELPYRSLAFGQSHYTPIKSPVPFTAGIKKI
jgi:hypothetical protein